MILSNLYDLKQIFIKAFEHQKVHIRPTGLFIFILLRFGRVTSNYNSKFQIHTGKFESRIFTLYDL